MSHHVRQIVLNQKEEKMKLLCQIFAFTILASCSDESGSNLSERECSALGGKLVSGECTTGELPAEEMKKICEARGEEYLPEHNACLMK